MAHLVVGTQAIMFTSPSPIIHKLSMQESIDKNKMNST